MGVSINTIIRQASLRINGIAGSLPADVEAAYVTTPLPSIDSADFPLSFFRDTCLAVESKLATAIASYRDEKTRALHPWRSLLLSQTAAIPNRGTIPSVDSGGNQIIGVLGSVFDALDSEMCDEMPLDDVRIAVRNSGNWLKSNVYAFALVGNRIEHTRTNVKIDVCTYNRTTRTTAIATLTNNILLPDALEEAYVCGIVSLAIRDGAFTNQANTYRAYYRESLADLGRGGMPGLAQAA
jgi:hypothetical protein